MISIIIPTYNEEDYLSLLFNSIKDQSFSDYEVIVADNNSTDNTLSIAKSFGATITSGGLPGKGRNEGAKVASGDILLFLDADVILEKDFLLNCSNEFKERQLGVATCQIKPLSSLKIDTVAHYVYNIIMRIAQYTFPYAPGFCIFANRLLHESISGFDESILLGEDTEYVKRANKISKFRVLKSNPILVSIRRLERDGRFNILMKYLLCEVHVFFLGPVRTNIFNYTFGHDKNNNKD